MYSLRLDELGNPENDFHPSLGPFYLEYGNALLQNVETSNELFNVHVKNIGDISGNTQGMPVQNIYKHTTIFTCCRK